MQRKSVLQLATQGSCGKHVNILYFLINIIEYSSYVIWISPPPPQKKQHNNNNNNNNNNSLAGHLLGKLRTDFTGLIANPKSPGLPDTTFFARWFDHKNLYQFHQRKHAHKTGLCVGIEGWHSSVVWKNTNTWHRCLNCPIFHLKLLS